MISISKYYDMIVKYFRANKDEEKSNKQTQERSFQPSQERHQNVQERGSGRQGTHEKDKSQEKKFTHQAQEHGTRKQEAICGEEHNRIQKRRRRKLSTGVRNDVQKSTAESGR